MHPHSVLDNTGRLNASPSTTVGATYRRSGRRGRRGRGGSSGRCGHARRTIRCRLDELLCRPLFRGLQVLGLSHDGVDAAHANDVPARTGIPKRRRHENAKLIRPPRQLKTAHNPCSGATSSRRGRHHTRSAFATPLAMCGPWTVGTAPPWDTAQPATRAGCSAPALRQRSRRACRSTPAALCDQSGPAAPLGRHEAPGAHSGAAIARQRAGECQY